MSIYYVVREEYFVGDMEYYSSPKFETLSEKEAEQYILKNKFNGTIETVYRDSVDHRKKNAVKG